MFLKGMQQCRQWLWDSEDDNYVDKTNNDVAKDKDKTETTIAF